jgi:hypothetical protein
LRGRRAARTCLQQVGSAPRYRAWLPADLTPRHLVSERAEYSLDRGLGLGEELFDAGDVFGDVDADGVVLYLSHANFPAIFEPA